jgi:uncharacterized protein YqeY
MASALLDKLMADIKQAMKDRAQDKLTALRTLHAQIKDATVNQGREPTDDDVLTMLNRGIKQRQDAVEQFRQGGREDLALKEESEIACYRQYQPAQLDASAIEALARNAIAEAGATGKADTGKVMKLLMPQVKGKADGRLVNQIVSTLLP